MYKPHLVAEMSFDVVKSLQESKKSEGRKRQNNSNSIKLKPSALSTMADFANPNAAPDAPPAFVNTCIMDTPSDLSERMFPHQLDGLRWLASLHSNAPGGILGDDMGMGKTFTVVSFLTSLFRTHTIRKVLILCPVSVLESWNREICNHLLPHVHKCYAHLISSDVSKAKREKILEEVLFSHSRTRKHVCVASYTLMSNGIANFARKE